MANDVRTYYERNTPLFLSLGIGAKTLAMRRAVWADGVTGLAQAVEYVNTLIAAEVVSRRARNEERTLRVLDIGCGVGGSLFFLCGATGHALRGIGVTISPRQAQIARRHARRRGLSGQLSFLAADFTVLEGLPRVHVAFAIESFGHFPTPTAFFEATARALMPGGRAVVVDDFLSGSRLSRHEDRLVRAFRRGWLLPSLCPVSRAVRIAASFGLRPVEDRNLSSRLSLLRVNAHLVSFLSFLMNAIPLPWPYWSSTAGSLALAACRKTRLVEYHYLVFEKAKA